jgi:ABC-type tungstate transport system substrate-binding protein
MTVQFADQHRVAIKPTVRVENKVECAIFDDKVTEMGTVSVSGGNIKIKLDYLPGMISDDAQRDFVVDSIRLGLEACWNAKSDAFDPHSR